MNIDIAKDVLFEGAKSIGNFNVINKFFVDVLKDGGVDLNTPKGFIKTTATFLRLQQAYLNDFKNILDQSFNREIKKTNAYKLAKETIYKDYFTAGFLGIKSIAPKTKVTDVTDDVKKMFDKFAATEYKYFKALIDNAFRDDGAKGKQTIDRLKRRAENFAKSMEAAFLAGNVLSVPSGLLMDWKRNSGESCVSGKTHVYGSFGVSKIESLKSSKRIIFGGTKSKVGFDIKMSGIQKTYRVSTYLGYTLNVTGDQLMMSLNDANELFFKRVDEIKDGDMLVMKRDIFYLKNKVFNECTFGRAFTLGFLFACNNKYNNIKCDTIGKSIVISSKIGAEKKEIPYIGAKTKNGELTFFINRKKYIGNLSKYGFDTPNPNLAPFIRDKRTAIAFCYGFMMRYKGFSHAQEYVFDRNMGSRLSILQNMLLSVGIISSRQKVDGKYHFRIINKNQYIKLIKDLLSGLRYIRRDINFNNDYDAEVENINAEYNGTLLDDRYIVVRAKNIMPNKHEIVYDVMDMPDETFIANGFIIHNCSDCIALEAGSPYTLEGARRLWTLPRSGDTKCLFNCKCTINVRKVGTAAPNSRLIYNRSLQNLVVDVGSLNEPIDFTDYDTKQAYELTVGNNNYIGFIDRIEDGYIYASTTRGKFKAPSGSVNAYVIRNESSGLIPEKIKSLSDIPETFKMSIGRSTKLLEEFGYYQREGIRLGYKHYDLYAWTKFKEKYEKDLERQTWKNR